MTTKSVGQLTREEFDEMREKGRHVYDILDEDLKKTRPRLRERLQGLDDYLVRVVEEAQRRYEKSQKG